MAEDNPELQARLEELDHELAEGDITEKGYNKRRTVLLSQYLAAPPIGQGQGGLRVHSPADTLHPTNDGSRTASLAALNARSSSTSPQPPRSPGALSSSLADRRSAAGSSTVGDYGGSHIRDEYITQGGGFHGRQLDIPDPRMQRQSSNIRHHDSLFLPDSGSQNISQEPTMTMSGDYAFNPERQGGYNTQGSVRQPIEDQSRQSTLLESQQGYFSDFTDQQGYQAGPESYGGGPHRYSDAFSPTAAMAPPMLKPSDLPSPGQVNHLMPLEPRDVPFAVYDPHNANLPMSKFDNIGAVLRHRARHNAKQPAFWVLDLKGKETASITWEKLASRAEKVAQVIRDKSNLYKGDRVALIYRDTELIEFAVALLGCFIAGVVAVPLNEVDDYSKLNVILTSTQAHLALTTDNNLKAFQRDITSQKLNWPRGVEWWKTNEFGSYHPKKKDEISPLVVPDLAYIEFTRAPTGDLRGVVMSHRTIMHQMACLSAIISTVPTDDDATAGLNSGGLRDRNGRLLTAAGSGETILSYLDPRQGIGMILGILLSVYGGHTMTWMEPKTVETPGLYAHLITKYKTTLMVAEYPGLKHAAYNYQKDPLTTRNFKKNVEPNFSTVKLCLIDTLTVDAEFHELLADRWFKPMRNPRAQDVVAPMLCLPEYGGMVISLRDWLGGEEHMGTILKLDLEDDDDDDEAAAQTTPASQNGYGSLIGGQSSKLTAKKGRAELMEVLLDRESLKVNEVIVLAKGEEAKRRANEPGAIRVGAFGYPIPDATLAIVDPETCLLAPPYVVGEIWVDSPSLSGGFWALPKHTESIFHARPYRFMEGNPTPVVVEPEFLRTGLLGTVIEGKIFVLGLYEDRLRQRVEWVERGMEATEYRYFFVQHLIVTIMKNVGTTYDCSAFDVFVNDEHLPIILLESQAASTQPVPGGVARQLDNTVLDGLSERCMEVLYQVHHLRVYCVMITAPNTLPRATKNGRRQIGNMLCRKQFDEGGLACVHVKFGIERAVLNIPIGVDPIGGIWSPTSARAREEYLLMNDKQYSGVDHREVVIDDRTSTPLNNFFSIVDLLQWRTTRQTEELAYCTVDGRGKEGKGVTWKKLDLKIAAVATYLKNKIKVKAGDHIILMYTHSEDFVWAVHACFCLGVVAIPIAPLDQNRLAEDVPAFLNMVKDFHVKAIIVNSDVDHLLKQKPVSSHIKQSAAVLKITVPGFYSTAKPTKAVNSCQNLGYTVKPEWIKSGYPVLIWTYWTPDQRRIAVQLGHDTIMGTCKVQKETCQMTSSRPVLGCVRSTSGLGFIHTCLMGIFVGAPTYLVSPVDFAGNPLSLFLTLSRYNVKDTYATSQMLDHAMNMMPGKGFNLQELKNLMISTDGRPRVDVFQKVRQHFAQTGLDRTAINTIYSHVLNPMVASRSYMCIEPIELWLDTKALRKGFIHPVDPDTDRSALLIQDSGMVPVSTQIAIVNPETCRLCHIGEYGEIWVDSDACVRAFYGSKDAFDNERFNGRTADGDPDITYVRTGDLGFLHNVSRPIGPNGALVEMQILFVLGGIGETFEVHGLSHFPMDIEYSVERAHRNICPGGSAIFQAGGLIVLVVEVFRRAYLASIVPILVNQILNEHQLIVDIVSFVSKGDFPRSRLGEKQRGKILGSWVMRKLNTIAQFAVRDVDDSEQIAEGVEPTLRGETTGSMASSGLRNVESSPALIQQQQQNLRNSESSPPEKTYSAYDTLPTGISEMPADYDDILVNSPDENTPTNAATGSHFGLSSNVDNNNLYNHNPDQKLDYNAYPDISSAHAQQHPFRAPSLSDIDESSTSTLRQDPPSRHRPPQLNLPPQPSLGGLMDATPWAAQQQQQQQQPRPQPPPRAPGSQLRAVNSTPQDEIDWPTEAIMHMNLAGGDVRALPSPSGREMGEHAPPR